DHVRPGLVGQLLAAPVAKGVELFDIAEFQRGLRLDARLKARFEGAMVVRIERSEGQCVAGRVSVADRQDAGAAAANRDDRRVEADFDRRPAGGLVHFAGPSGRMEKVKGLSPL